MSFDVFGKGRVRLTQFGWPPNIQITTDFQHWIQLNREEAALLARELRKWLRDTKLKEV